MDMHTTRRDARRFVPKYIPASGGLCGPGTDLIIGLMPWESRIASEPRRRWVVAAIMLALLAGATFAATWITHTRQPQLTVRSHQPTETFGRFALAVPRGWSRRHAPADARDRLKARLADGERLLDVLVLGGDRLLTPRHMLTRAARNLCPATTWHEDVIAVHRGPLATRMIVGNSIGAVDGRRVLGKDVLAIATIDGETYLVLHLSGRGEIRRHDVELVHRMITSTDDTRYRTLDEPNVQANGIRLSAPGHGVMFTRSDSGPDHAAWVGSRRSDVFFRVEVRAMTADGLRRRWREYGVEQADHARLDELLAATLQATYYSATGRRPPRSALERGRVAGRDVLRLGLANLRQHEGHHERWAVQLGRDHLLLMDLVSDARSLDALGAAARHIVEHAAPPHGSTTQHSPRKSAW